MFQVDEEKNNQIRLQELIEKLQEKIRVYKKQIEDAEEIAALNLAKYRKAQHELDDAAERADQAENQVAKARAQSRGARGASTMRASTPQVI